MSELFNNLVKLGNKNPDLRDDISPVLHHLKKAGGKTASNFTKALMSCREKLRDKMESDFSKVGKIATEVDGESRIIPFQTDARWPGKVILSSREEDFYGEVIIKNVYFEKESFDLLFKVDFEGKKGESEEEDVSANIGILFNKMDSLIRKL